MVVVAAAVVVVAAAVVVVAAAVVVVSGWAPAQVWDKLKLLGASPSGVIVADEPESRRSVNTDPDGTATNTLSVWRPFLMIIAPVTRYGDPRLRVIETNVYVPLLGAMTKCQYATFVSVGHSSAVPGDAVSLFRYTVCVATTSARGLAPTPACNPGTMSTTPATVAKIPAKLRF